ncbi:MAG: helix-turn-helix domain-containing protein [Actinobacteria bacterium]|nr:helix-turn-helix domain-containing protein [Actinomycetota bacterium]NBO35279.1 helix-turn-helix domain-containing protein [Actinomycetota bacterium]
MANLIAQAREQAGVTQDLWAELSGTSRPTLSAYENGRKSPQLSTVERMFEVLSLELVAVPKIKFHKVITSRGNAIYVPNQLPQLPAGQAHRKLQLPIHINWSDLDKEFNLASRKDRERVYELVLQEGNPRDIVSIIDGALLVDLWSEIVIPKKIRLAWQPLIDQVLVG